MDDHAAAPQHSDDRLIQEATHRIRARRAFRTHLLVYSAVNLLLILIWLVTGIRSGAWSPWFIFSLAGWGIGIAAHAWSVYGPHSRPITDDAVAAEIQRMTKAERPERA